MPVFSGSASAGAWATTKAAAAVQCTREQPLVPSQFLTARSESIDTNRGGFVEEMLAFGVNMANGGVMWRTEKVANTVMLVIPGWTDRVPTPDGHEKMTLLCHTSEHRRPHNPPGAVTMFLATVKEHICRY